MTYNDLKWYFAEYHLGNINKKQLACAIHIYQRANNINPVTATYIDSRQEKQNKRCKCFDRFIVVMVAIIAVFFVGICIYGVVQ